MSRSRRGHGGRAGFGLLLVSTLVVVACTGSATGDTTDRAATEVDQTSTSPSTTAESSVTSSSVTVSTTPPSSTPSSTEAPAPDAEPSRAPEPDDPLPTGPDAMADALTRAETAIRDPAIGDGDAAAWGRHQQRLYRHLARNSEWAEGALAIDDPLLREAVEANWTARVNLDALVASEEARAEVPAWRVVAPRPVDELLAYYRDGEAAWGISWSYLAAINLIETRMGRIEGLSSAGAVGPMQFLPTTWAECCQGDPTDPADAIPGAARYLTIRGGPDDMDRAIWGYNNSDRYVAAVKAYASVLRANELAYRGYHAWEIYFRSTEGLLLLPVGYEEPEPVPADRWLLDHPEHLVDRPLGD